MRDVYDSIEDKNPEERAQIPTPNADELKKGYDKIAGKGHDNPSTIQNETNQTNNSAIPSDANGSINNNSVGNNSRSSQTDNKENPNTNNTSDNKGKEEPTADGAGAKAGEVAEDAGGEVAKEASKEMAQEAAKEASKTAATEMVADAAAAPTAGTSKLAQLALEVASRLANKVKQEISEFDPSTQNKSSSKAIILAAVCAFLLLWVGTSHQKMTVGSMANHQQTSYSKTLTDRGASESDVGKIEKNFAEEDLDEYGEELFLSPGFYDYVYGVKFVKTPGNAATKKKSWGTKYNDMMGKRDSTTGLRNALHDAVMEECYAIVNNLGKKSLRKFINKYDEEKSFETFYNNPFPYDLQSPSGATPVFPRIGDVMKRAGKKYSEDYISYAPKYNDVNYVEMLAIFSCNPEYNWEKCDYEEFNEYIRTQRAKNLYYEMKVTWMVVYRGSITTTDSNGNQITKEESAEKEYKTEKDACDSPESLTVNGIVCKRDSYYCKIKLKPFGLRELYLMAQVSPNDKHEDFYNHTNFQLLDRHERHTRVYMRDDEYRGGPSYKEKRSIKSSIYQDLVKEYGEAKGRSAWCYIAEDETYNLKDLSEISFDIPSGHTPVNLDDLNIDTSNLTAQQVALLQFLFSTVGCSYDQGNRWGENTYDCSSLVIRAYRSIGISIEGIGNQGIAGDWRGGTTTACIYGWGVATGNLSDTLKVGSIIVYNHGGTANQDGISHVGIYVGDGMMIDARGRAYGVVYRMMSHKNIYAIVNPL